MKRFNKLVLTPDQTLDSDSTTSCGELNITFASAVSVRQLADLRRRIMALLLLFCLPVLLSGQTTDPLISKCAMASGPNTTFLKDFRVQLPKGTPVAELRYKQVFPLSKNMTYKITLCNADNSKGQLIMNIRDSQGNLQASSYDPKSGKAYPEIRFTCKQTGQYKLNFDFRDFQEGLGVGIVSLVK